MTPPSVYHHDLVSGKTRLLRRSQVSFDPGAYEVDDRATRRFFVMRNPMLRGFNAHDDADLGLMRKLDYVIVNKTRLSYIYDFNE